MVTPTIFLNKLHLLLFFPCSCNYLVMKASNLNFLQYLLCVREHQTCFLSVNVHEYYWDKIRTLKNFKDAIHLETTVINGFKAWSSFWSWFCSWKSIILHVGLSPWALAFHHTICKLDYCFAIFLLYCQKFSCYSRNIHFILVAWLFCH